MKTTFMASLLFLSLPVSLSAKNQLPVQERLSPSQVIAQSTAKDWQPIEASDLLIMSLSPNAKGQKRNVVIQLLPAPFSQGWVSNIRKLAAQGWWDGDTAIVRVQDNYVTQWGDPNGETVDKAKALPDSLQVMTESDYVTTIAENTSNMILRSIHSQKTYPDHYAQASLFWSGWPMARNGEKENAQFWPIHCYAMVGVGRNYSPDTGTGAELYTVIGHAPRHLDQNIALVGRIIEGMEHMSSLPRGTSQLGFYETPEERTKIESVKLVSDISNPQDRPKFEYLSTQSDVFSRYAKARANRSDPFFITPAGGADICNVQVPVRRKS